MPTHAAANQAIQQMYINGHFCYAYKFGIVTNGLGISINRSFSMTSTASVIRRAIDGGFHGVEPLRVRVRREHRLERFGQGVDRGADHGVDQEWAAGEHAGEGEVCFEGGDELRQVGRLSGQVHAGGVDACAVAAASELGEQRAHQGLRAAEAT